MFKPFKFKIGEHIVAKKNVTLMNDEKTKWEPILIKGKSYLIKNIIGEKRLVFDSEDKDNRCFDLYSWDEYFYNKQEMRKLKLEKLNEI